MSRIGADRVDPVGREVCEVRTATILAAFVQTADGHLRSAMWIGLDAVYVSDRLEAKAEFVVGDGLIVGSGARRRYLMMPAPIESLEPRYSSRIRESSDGRKTTHA